MRRWRLYSTVHPEDEPEVVTGVGAGTPQLLAGLWSQLSLSLLKAPEGISVRGFQGPVPLSLPELPAGSQGQGVLKDRASPPLRTGLEERVAKVLRDG